MLKKVIEGLEHCAVEPIVECEGCPYKGDSRCEALLKQEALAELKIIVMCSECTFGVYSEDYLGQRIIRCLDSVRPLDWYCASGKKRK